MQIKGLKINGIPEPIGYDFDHLSLSWYVAQATGTMPEQIEIDVAEDEAFQAVLFHSEGRDLSCEGTALDVSPRPRTRYYVRLRIRDNTGDSGEAATFFETGKMDESWSAAWIGTAAADTFHPVFRKEFTCPNKPKHARLYLCGLGLFEAYLNGRKIGRELLTPYYTDYSELAQVITFDVTELLDEHNELKVFLGNGWYKGRFGLDNGHCGDRFALIAELHITDQAGAETIVKTDESWQYAGSDIRDSGIYDGEILDRRLWSNTPNPWRKAELIPQRPVQTADRLSLPVRVMEQRKPEQLILTPAGEYVLDMGQNFAGWVEFRSELPEGTEVHLTFGEVLQNGNFYQENYRSAVGGFTYVSGGQPETVRPHFTYFGFRYVKVSGWPGEPDPELFTGCIIYSELERTGHFSSDHAGLNRLYENTVWGQKSNFLDIPTDCPQRDERLGWTGDAQIFAPTASYHMDTRAFYHKYLRMMRLEQKKQGGAIPGYIPAGKALCPVCALWGDAATFLPDTLWRFYRDRAALTAYYPMMKDWVDYVGSQMEEKRGARFGLWDFSFQFGDWLALDGRTEQEFKGATPDEYVASMYYCKSLEIVAKAARILNVDERDQYQALYEKQREFLLSEYFTPNGHLSVNTQAAYIIAIEFDICRDRTVLSQDFLKELKRDGFRIRAGFSGSPVLCQMLSKCGHPELAYTFLLNESYPGWLYAVSLGATTVWERWNSLLPDGSISGTGMNSLNHYSYGSVSEFLYACVLGIRPSEEGFRKAVLAPQPDGRLHHASGSYRSACGEYALSWQIKDDGAMHIELTVPFGCSATVTLPGSDQAPFEVSAGTYQYEYMPQQDYRRIFQPDCLLGQVFGHPSAKEVLLTLVPQAAAMDTAEGHEKQISDLFELAAFGADPSQIGAAVGALAQLAAW